MRIPPRLSFLFLCLGLSLSPLPLRADGLPSGTLAGDSFTLAPGAREAGRPLNGQPLEVGGTRWRASAGLVFAPGGLITENGTAGAVGVADIPPVANPVTLQADLDPTQTGFAAIGFLASGGPDEFWHTVQLWVTLLPDGTYVVMANGVSLTVARGKAVLADGALTHVELSYDPAANTVSLRINGNTVVKSTGLDAFNPDIHCIGFRFQEPVGINGPRLDNLALTAALPMEGAAASPAPAAGAGKLGVADVSQFLIAAGQDATLRFSLGAAPADAPAPQYRLSGYDGRTIADGVAAVDGAGGISVPVNAPPGFCELSFPGRPDVFGLVSLPPAAPADPFFGIDASLSWLSKLSRPYVSAEQAVTLRPPLIQGLKRMSVAIARERLSWGLMRPSLDKWDWDVNQFDSTRKVYEQSGVQVLEMYHGGPAWTVPSHPYPSNLVGVARAWQEIGQRWQPAWGGLEIWNEPDLETGSTADQYVPLVKMMRYALRDGKVSTPIVGGVFAYLNMPYLRTAAQNGILDDCDAISFHYYESALGLENHVAAYRAWLKEFGYEAKPLWLTEIGLPWHGPTDQRPDAATQKPVALNFAMDAVESKACGIARHFPFVYPLYSEKGANNFGMLDSNMAPLRQMASYAAAARILAGADYCGDLAVPGTQRTRVFARPDGGAVVVLYTGKVEAGASVKVAFPFAKAFGIDGRELKAADGAVPVPAGLAYLAAQKADLARLLVTDTLAARLSAIGRQTPPPLPAPSPIVIQPIVDAASAIPTSRAYNLPEQAKSLSLRLRISNLSDHEAALQIQVPTSADLSATVPPQSSQEVSATVDVSALPADQGGIKVLRITAKAPGVERIAPVSLSLVPSRGMDAYLKSNPYQFALPIADENRWTKNAAGPLEFTKSAEAAWGFQATFAKGDRWAFPKFSIPQEVDYEKIDGVLIRARAVQATIVRILTWDADKKMSMTSFSIVPPDGEWHVAYVPLDSFLTPQNGDPHLGRQIRQFAVGVNSTSDTATLEVSDLYFLGTPVQP